MANDLDWHKFYHHRWAGDQALKLMTVEQVGAYWMLLVEQMLEGDLPEDPTRLARLLKNMDPAYFVERIWENRESYQLREKFAPVPGRPGRIHQEHLTRVMQDDKERRSKLSAAGRMGYQTKALETSLDQPAADGTRLDYGAVWKEFPRRKNPSDGYSEGMRLLREVITTPEDYRLFMAAVRNYAKACKKPGHDRQFTKRLDRFLQEWRDHLPKGMQDVEETPAPKPALTVVEGGAPKRRVLPKGDSPPWVPGYRDSEREKALMAAYWTPERQERWWAGEDIPPEEWVAFSTKWQVPAELKEAVQ